MFHRRYARIVAPVAFTLAAFVMTARTSFSEPGAGRVGGSWQATVTATNPPGLPSFTSLITFADDGTVIESRRPYVAASPFGPMFETPGHGSWTRTGVGDFDVSFMFLLQRAADGSDVGTDNIRLHLHLNPAGNHLTGTLVSNIQDTAGDVLFMASGTYDAKPIP